MITLKSIIFNINAV